MDDIDRLLADIRGNPDVARVSFSSGFLNSLADVYEKHGHRAAWAYLLEKRRRRELRVQAEAALRVLDMISRNERAAADRRIGRLILKTLPALFDHGPQGG